MITGEANISKAPSFITPAPPVSSDKLDRVREAVKQLRNLDLEVNDAEEHLKSLKKSATTLRQTTLPDLFDEAGVTSLGLEKDGNHPPCIASVQPHYHASIPADWPEDQRNEAFTILEELGGAEIIRVNIVVDFGKGEHAQAQELKKLLDKVGYDYSEKLGVPWTTLTAFLREYVEREKKVPADLEKLGATVGRQVKVKPVKEK